MGNLLQTVETVAYKVILVVAASKVVLAIEEGRRFRLPRVFIPKWTRPAEEITKAIQEQWNLNAIVLRILPTREAQPACAVTEVIGSRIAEAYQTFCSCVVDAIDKADLDVTEQERVSAVLVGDAGSDGPFSRLGWVQEAQAWIQQSLSDRSVDFSDDVRQYNAGDTFALIRFGTREGRAYWLKATGEPNKHEYNLISTLSKLFPEHLPPLVATRDDWNAWVTAEAGSPVGESQSLESLTRTVESLAELQIRSIGHIPCLEAAGCFDNRLGVLRGRLVELIAYVDDAMGHQTSTKVSPVPRPRLDAIGSIVEQACLKMEALNIPVSLVNGDINLDNVLHDGARHVFIDWAEAGVGNPFLTFQQLVQHVVRDGENSGWEAALRDTWKAKWLAILSEHQINRAFALTPLLTMASYLYGRGDWLTSSRRDEPNFQGFARTLARYMDRACEDPMLLEGLSQ